MRTGQVRTGQVGTGQVKSGQLKSGQVHSFNFVDPLRCLTHCQFLCLFQCKFVFSNVSFDFCSRLLAMFLGFQSHADDFLWLPLSFRKWSSRTAPSGLFEIQFFFA